MDCFFLVCKGTRAFNGLKKEYKLGETTINAAFERFQNEVKSTTIHIGEGSCVSVPQNPENINCERLRFFDDSGTIINYSQYMEVYLHRGRRHPDCFFKDQMFLTVGQLIDIERKAVVVQLFPTENGGEGPFMVKGTVMLNSPDLCVDPNVSWIQHAETVCFLNYEVRVNKKAGFASQVMKQKRVLAPPQVEETGVAMHPLLVAKLNHRYQKRLFKAGYDNTVKKNGKIDDPSIKVQASKALDDEEYTILFQTSEMDSVSLLSECRITRQNKQMNTSSIRKASITEDTYRWFNFKQVCVREVQKSCHFQTLKSIRAKNYFRVSSVNLGDNTSVFTAGLYLSRSVVLR